MNLSHLTLENWIQVKFGVDFAKLYFASHSTDRLKLLPDATIGDIHAIAMLHWNLNLEQVYNLWLNNTNKLN